LFFKVISEDEEEDDDEEEQKNVDTKPTLEVS